METERPSLAGFLASACHQDPLHSNSAVRKKKIVSRVGCHDQRLGQLKLDLACDKGKQAEHALLHFSESVLGSLHNTCKRGLLQQRRLDTRSPRKSYFTSLLSAATSASRISSCCGSSGDSTNLTAVTFSSSVLCADIFEEDVMAAVCVSM